MFSRWNVEDLCRQFTTKYPLQDNPAVYHGPCGLRSGGSFGEVWPGEGKPEGLLHCPGEWLLAAPPSGASENLAFSELAPGLIPSHCAI